MSSELPQGAQHRVGFIAAEKFSLFPSRFWSSTLIQDRLTGEKQFNHVYTSCILGKHPEMIEAIRNTIKYHLMLKKKDVGGQLQEVTRKGIMNKGKIVTKI